MSTSFRYASSTGSGVFAGGSSRYMEFDRRNAWYLTIEGMNELAVPSRPATFALYACAIKILGRLGQRLRPLTYSIPANGVAGPHVFLAAIPFLLALFNRLLQKGICRSLFPPSGTMLIPPQPRSNVDNASEISGFNCDIFLNRVLRNGIIHDKTSCFLPISTRHPGRVFGNGSLTDSRECGIASKGNSNRTQKPRDLKTEI